MTIVKKENYAAESLAKLCLEGHSVSEVKRRLLTNFFISVSEDAVMRVFALIKKADIPRLPTRTGRNETAWFDIESDKYAINVKYAYESSANSRIRDITREANADIKRLAGERKEFTEFHIQEYDLFRNVTLHGISNSVRKNCFPIIVSDDVVLQIKLAYLVCMNLTGCRNEGRAVFFFNFKKDFSPFLYQVAWPGIEFDFRSFVNRCEIRFSTNVRCGDPHKKTIQFMLSGKSIGFFELRSNKRAMLQLRQSEGDWDNLVELRLIKNIS